MREGMTIPSNEAVLDLKSAVERVMLTPDEELEGIVVFAVARMPNGKARNRIVIAPLDRQDRLLKLLRGYFDGPEDLVEYRRE